ncbi:MAG: D-2-hydroxyacid dehydrogenase family protein [Lautropia sp.]
MKVAILDDYADSVRTLQAFSRLDGHDVIVLNETLAPDALAERIRDREALVLIRERTRITDALLAKLPALRLLVQTARSGPHIDLAACAARGVAVADGSGAPDSTVELTIGLMIAAARNIAWENARLLEGRWQTRLGRGLVGRRLGIYGYGKIGRRVAQVASALGMQVVAFGREASITAARADGLQVVPDAPALFAGCDVVSLHLRLNDQTRGVVTAAHLGAMKPDAMLVNTARAELIAPGALLAALDAGRPGLAALDVFEHEPTPDMRIVRHPRVLATPHLGYVEAGNYERYFGEAFDSLNAFARGQPTRLVTA